MKSGFSAFSVAAVTLGILSLAPSSRAQNQTQAQNKPTPHTPEGHADLNGFWSNALLSGSLSNDGNGTVTVNIRRRGKLCDEDACQQANQPSYKPAYAAKVKSIGDTQSQGTTYMDPQFECKPLGVPRAGTRTMQIVETPQVVAILYEDGPGPIWRLIYTDGRPHPKDLDSSYWGHSIGHWDGDTLVVDVVGLNDETWLGGGLPGDMKYTSIHSDQEHVVERWTRNGDTITYEATVDDPIMFAKPWTITPRQIQMGAPGDEVFETPCFPDRKIREH